MRGGRRGRVVVVVIGGFGEVEAQVGYDRMLLSLPLLYGKRMHVNNSTSLVKRDTIGIDKRCINQNQ